MIVAAAKKRSKYRNKKCGKYDSIREAERAAELELLERAGHIQDLREQVEFELVPKQKGERSVSYMADFVYIENGLTVVEDVKGFKTREFVIKRKLMLWLHGIRIKVTR